MLSLALAVTSMPAAAAETMGALISKIQRAQDRRRFAEAAQWAHPASQRTDLSRAHRYLLAGLASESYGDAFARGGAPKQPPGDPKYLCDQRTVLQEAAALASAEQGATVDAALQEVAKQLALVAASGRTVPCEVSPTDPGPPAESPHSTTQLELPSTPRMPTTAHELGPSPVEGPTPLAPVLLSPPRPRVRIGVGVGLLVTSAGLAGGMVASLVTRGHMNATITALDAAATAERRELTPQEAAAVDFADARYVRLGEASAVLGTLAGLGLITGLILLAVPSKPRPSSQARVHPTVTGIRVAF